MKRIKYTEDLQRQCAEWRAKGLKVGLVPTMGYFHDGHLALMDHARSMCDKLVVTLFVNPTQFGPNEDLDAYPHDLERDSQLAWDHGADLLFAPAPEAMYAPDHATWVEVPELAQNLCGESRPTHFRGVCTVVMKLFMLTLPHVAVFGQKDWQQLAILKRMVRDLNIPVDIQGHPIVREKDGLALSSRNAYLTPEEREHAPFIRKALLEARKLAQQGETDALVIKDFIRQRLGQTMPMAEPDYIEMVDPNSIQPIMAVADSALIAVAVRLGKARLIDNILIKVD
ncbi:pantoate--beta-alanine ligase [Pseudodesulfovibrio senegalensis]|jgi:pantoate--beta-alanine ligase|uniref:Pantothenate synthetase n=1 Tax=Pseudodesulfovibrio senegalensis TaxID=1721087 RepID=A0A6N6MXS3_9BACT|nr:pantoate--beta-alanine ligase [Pseudodesulfovibrio senegalensis]KAB1438809.1 pantoate--beta-alanine ligase [Pseudodesulfovibrio senegalensis]